MAKIFNGIDVSKWQLNPNWAKIKQDGIDFAILRCGYTGYGKGKKQSIDKTFEKKYKGAKAQCIPVGAYFFSRATTEAEGLKEAQFVHSLLKGKQFEYPIYIDVEDTYYQKKASIKAVTNATKAFCSYLEEKGYYVGIYASKSWLENKLDLKQLAQYDKWVAQWSKECTFKESHGMWQWTSKGKVNGIIGRVDKNIAHKNYPNIMKTNGLNGFAKHCNKATNPYSIPSDKDVIRRGHEGESVKWVQWELVRLGFDIGRGKNNEPKGIDGCCGPKTQQAILNFQINHKDQHGKRLAVDGCAGPLTRWAMAHA